MTKDYYNVIKQFSDKLPKFPDGRINYSGTNRAPVINALVKYRDEILILKRSDKVANYKGKWNSIGGFLDEAKPLKQKVLEEVNEELGITEDEIEEARLFESYVFYDESIDKTWISFPALIELKVKPEIKLDQEHTDYKWIKPEDLKKYEFIPGLDEAIKKILK
ncbi:TPA: hypothetical protein DDW69_01450 [candidate division CPR2 bacterium]|uniref:NUDIX hydrolase n=1 Tax=candidate division CPR2 bacterium GW2011_GWC1_41_48 TaxID=1618344 RepID=A0A0G0WCB7_UNCC2|nr:MAG: NUDIX hydrolase [candidate division CPR2 bacterium GW2011_GWC2_39_35]KKR28256.1 MAG: NUDIX hydrolase [candidate division CPR2 bacterium GW2011_GWD1_39_7]KKS09687.1 MAG: NUDIX hydrolase [candidate division CPR2 bacterium GW2011_GWC1_41_48]OGB60451.1 MAG: hypothetical protein A2Y27_01325 [candidate division CPR2 bacterium GWD1_39_7]HBG81485.1 hypothetical protein [candidate division CPR2 bacterium]